MRQNRINVEDFTQILEYNIRVSDIELLCKKISENKDIHAVVGKGGFGTVEVRYSPKKGLYCEK